VVKISTFPPSPLSPKRWPAESFRWYWSLGFAALVVGALFVPIPLAAAVLMVFGVAHERDFRNPLAWPTLTAELVGIAVALPVLLALLPLLAQRSLRELGLRMPRLRDLAWGVGGAIAMVAVAAMAASLQEHAVHLKADEVQVHLLRAARGLEVPGIVILACVVAPIVEELLFRGFLFNALLRYTPVWLAVVLCGALFGLAHNQPGNLGALAPLAAVGMVLATIYYRSGSLVAAMLAHASFNSLTVATVLVLHQQF
jgi:membrane protease YdiL (CAAX protease family)